jgi:hypothetical protein
LKDGGRPRAASNPEILAVQAVVVVFVFSQLEFAHGRVLVDVEVVRLDSAEFECAASQDRVALSIEVIPIRARGTF